MRGLCLALLFVVPLTYGRSQAGEEARDFTTLLQDICAQPAADEAPYHMLEQQLWEYYHAPLDLNHTSREALSTLYILTDTQLDHFIRHVARHGPLVSIYELQAIPTLDLPTIRRLQPFVYVDEVAADYRNRPWWAPAMLGARNSYISIRYQRTMPTQKGYQQNREGVVPYLGSPHELAMRLHIRQPWGLGIGLSTQKGSGETLTWDPATRQYGFSPWRFHVLLKDQKYLKALVLGDYAVGYGQGLVLNAGFSASKSSEAIRVMRTNNLGIRPHTALGQAAFRGLAATWQWNLVEWTIYGSSVALDGTVRGEPDMHYVQTLYRGGYYRTQNDLKKKGRIREQVIGSTVVYKGPVRSAEVGINILYGYYSLPLCPDSEKHPPCVFKGQHYANSSIFYKYLWHNLLFFGEGGIARHRQVAALAGVVASLSRYADATILWRHYRQGFYSPYGKAFRENASGNCNERGLYLGAKVRPLRRLHLDAYYDYFYFPWQLGRRTSGYGWLLKGTYQLSRKSLLYLQCKAVVKPKKITEPLALAISTQHIGKLCGKYFWSKAVRTNSELQCAHHRHATAPKWVYAAVQDLVYRIRSLQLKARVAYFNTTLQEEGKAAKQQRKDYPLYFYEPNVLHTGFNFPAYRGRGMRYCLLICYKPIATMRLEAKYALTWYYDRQSISSSNTAMEGHRKHDIKLQAVYKF
ncbi:MAG: hypothetical protein AAFP93_00250 [Bacteroidota bacterium]